jgi:hypothetical protein
LNQWLDYERDIRADYEKAFGEAPGALVGIGIMTDSDNTRSSTTAWYGPVQLGAAPQAAGRADLVALRKRVASGTGLRETPFDGAGTLAA